MLIGLSPALITYIERELIYDMRLSLPVWFEQERVSGIRVHMQQVVPTMNTAEQH